MEKWISKSRKGFLAILLIFASSIPLRSAEAPSTLNSESPEIMSWSGIRMITLGTRYMTEMPALASDWILKNKDGVIGGDFLNDQDEVKKIAKSVSDGMVNVGKMLVFIGIAKEYKDYFEYENNPKNPLNSNKEKYTPEVIRSMQEARLRYLQTALSFLRDRLIKQNIDAEWLLKLFDPQNDSKISRLTLSTMSQAGEVFENFNIYGIGIQISSDLPIGAMLTVVLNKLLKTNLDKVTGRASYEDSVGVMYYMKRKLDNDKEDFREDPLYRGLDPKHPIFEIHKREKYQFAAKTYEQVAGQIESLSYARGGAKKAKLEVKMTVRLTFLASTEVLRNFDIMNMNSTHFAELSVRNKLTNALKDKAKKIAETAQDKIQEAYDKSKHFEFLSSNMNFSVARVWGAVDENTGKALEVPNMLFRVSMGNYALTPVKGSDSSAELLNISGSLGSIRIDDI